jgi:hypothetical protein
MKNYSRLYVTGDGAWGVIDEDEFDILNCAMWTTEDFDELDSASDSQKLAVARAIADRVTREVLDDISL